MITAYKLFIVKHHQLYPLYVFANEPIETNVWLDAREGEMTKNGKVKSKLGELAFRPGWHSSDYPIALHIGMKKSVHDAKPSFRPDNQIWARILVNDNVNWQDVANQQGKSLRSKYLKFIPKNGFYRYKTNPNMFGDWIISGEMKIIDILSDDEVEKINSKINMSDLPRKK